MHFLCNVSRYAAAATRAGKPILNQASKGSTVSYLYTSTDTLLKGVAPLQLQDPLSSTFTYLLADSNTKNAVIIDPVIEQVSRDASLIKELGLQLRFAVNTHCHADHITGTAALKTHFPWVKSVISESSQCQADVLLKDGDKIFFGESNLLALATPGHTNGCITYYSSQGDGLAFTGDTLLIRGCGRTDFQNGDARKLYQSVHRQVFTLPSTTTVFPAHDYNGRTSSTISQERELNPRLTLSEESFVKVMQNLKLPYPQKLDEAIPANMVCGVV